MRLQLILGIVLILVLISGNVSQSYALSTLFPSSPPKQIATTYLDDILGFQVNFPATWHEGEPPENASIAFYSEDENAGIAVSYKQSEKIQLEKWAILNSANADTKKNLEKLFIKELVKNYPTGFKISTPKFTYYSDGLKGTWPFSYIIWVDGQKYQMKGNAVVWYLPASGDAYELDYFVEKSLYKTHYPTYAKAVKSFYVFPVTEETDEN